MTKLSKRLIAGPWVGEFGWELFAWQGYVRSLAKSFDEVVIMCRSSSRPLYEDFAHKFIDVAPIGGLSDSFFMHGLDINTYVNDILRENREVLRGETTFFGPRRIGNPPYTHFSEEMRFKDFLVKPEYVRYGKEAPQKYDYIFHIRDRKLRIQDNWTVEGWKQLNRLLTANGERVGCVGTSRESGYIEGADDLRDKPLKEVFDILRSCRAVFGPSSGPMHLASLCGAPHVVFSTPSVTQKDEIRYTRNWNPLSSPVLYLCESNKVSTPEEVYERYKEWNL